MSYNLQNIPSSHSRNASRLSNTNNSEPAKSSASSRAASEADIRARENRRGSQPKSFELSPYDHEDESETDEMGERRPAYNRHKDGRSGQPLLYKSDDERGRARDSPPITPAHPTFSRRSTMRSRSPADAQALLETKKKYTYAAFFLGLSLISFVIQTETAVYIQHELGWDKAYCMLYFTHGSWVLLYPFQLLCLRLQKRSMPFHTFWRRHVYLLRTTAQMVESQSLTPPRTQHSPVPYMLRTTAGVTTALTVAGGSWYLAVNMTTASDLTAIYNCSAFFAYAFSVPLLKEPLRMDKSLAVLVAIVGVLVVAYGDTSTITPNPGNPPNPDHVASTETEAKNRLAGNLIIGAGSVLYGLYEVLYKRLACPPTGCSPGRGMIFANTFGSLIGAFTLLVLWIPLPILHYTGLEPFALPRGEAAWMMCISVLANATFSGSFLVLISLTSPVLSSVAALLTIFLVAATDWALFSVPLGPAALAGGGLIVIAFGVLSWSTWREMREETHKELDITSDEDEESILGS
ncbi:hypothetical protein O988_01311 [Pseudogymnoascus sp. VKM F-3808]|nr:hypothetical protein O988_01311 [Pseudogymnoascus sp. VKM F-3808]